MSFIDNQAKLIKIHTKLNQSGYICPITFSAQVQVALNTDPVAGAFLFGPAGTGKSFLPETLAKIMDVEYLFYQCFPGTREDDLMLKMVPSETSASGISLFDGVITQAVKMTASGKKVILALDEWDKTRPSADSFLLDFLQNGRINFNGYSGRANMENLYLFITMNDERDLSEPLLRRLPKIDFFHHSPVLVKEALERTHKNHPFMDSAVVLYERCLMANMPKPATIQELRQLLDAITMLNVEKKADWDTLVYQFVTKTPENHMLLQETESKSVTYTPDKTKKPKLNPGKYELDEGNQSEIKKKTDEAESLCRLPKLSALRGSVVRIVPIDKTADMKESCGVVEHTDASYDACVGMTQAPKDNPSSIGDFAEVVKGNIINIVKPIPLCDVEKANGFWGKSGEILFVESNITHDDVRRLRDSGAKIVSYSTGEILGKSEGSEFRWDGKKLEIIADLTKRDGFAKTFAGLIKLAKTRQFVGKFYCDIKKKEKANIADFAAAVEGYTIERKGESVIVYKFPNASVVFYSDSVGVIINGKISDDISAHLNKWFPKLPMDYYGVSKYSEPELVKLGFTASDTTSKKSGNVVMKYKDGVIRFIVMLENYNMKDINDAIDTIDKERLQLCEG